MLRVRPGWSSEKFLCSMSMSMLLVKLKWTQAGGATSASTAIGEAYRLNLPIDVGNLPLNGPKQGLSGVSRRIYSTFRTWHRNELLFFDFPPNIQSGWISVSCRFGHSKISSKQSTTTTAVKLLRINTTSVVVWLFKHTPPLPAVIPHPNRNILLPNRREFRRAQSPSFEFRVPAQVV